MKRKSKKEKLVTLMVSAIIGLGVFAAAYSHFLSDMTEWQKSRNIDFSENTGSTKFKARVDALSIGGAAFCVTAVAITMARKIRKGKK